MISSICIISCAGGIIRYQAIFANQKSFDAHVHQKSCSLIAQIESLDEVPTSALPWLIKLRVHQIVNNHATISHASIIHLYTNPKFDLRIGDIICIDNVTFKKNNTKDFARYLLKENICAVLFMPHIDYKILSRPALCLKRNIVEYRQSLLSGLKSKLNSEGFDLFSSLFLGKIQKNETNKALKKDCLRWGISHYLARSGLHLVIFILLWQLLLNYLPIHIFYKNILLLMITGGYGLLTFSSISFIRAFLSLFFAKVCSLVLMPISTLQVLTLVCFLVILYNPLHIFFLDFQLSFLLTFALIFYNLVANAKKSALAQNY